MPIRRVVPAPALALIVLMFSSAVAAAAAPDDLASVRRLVRASASPDELAVLTEAVTSAPDAAGVAARDADAYRLLSLGYSAKETADVISGRISRRVLDTARRMLATGQRREAVESYLDRQYSTRLAQLTPPPAPPVPAPRRGPRAWPGRQFDALVAFYASRYNVDPAVVRAMMATESGFDPRAQSPKGAIGLMQLMPATARALGVNPWVVHENIEGGVRYFAEMLWRFGSTELALIAYNGGPDYARRYARREVALYGETRDYVRTVLARAASGVS